MHLSITFYHLHCVFVFIFSIFGIGSVEANVPHFFMSQGGNSIPEDNSVSALWIRALGLRDGLRSPADSMLFCSVKASKSVC